MSEPGPLERRLKDLRAVADAAAQYRRIVRHALTPRMEAEGAPQRTYSDVLVEISLADEILADALERERRSARERGA